MATPAQLLNKGRSSLCERLLAARIEKKLSWDELAKNVGLSPIFVASVCLGQNSIPPANGVKLLQVLGIDNEEDNAAILAHPPVKGQELDSLPRDPFMIRLQEINTVYGLALKEVTQELFGDGIMSAVDFRMKVSKVEDPNGDRVQVVLDGKFLPFKGW